MNEKSGKVLCVDDEPHVLRALQWLLKRDFEVHIAASAQEGLRLLRSHDFDVVVSDLAQVASGSYALRTAVLGQGNYVLLPGSYYSWRVRHFSAVSGWTGWSETAWFNLPAPSSATISVIAPAGGSRTPTIQWTDSSTSDFYFEVQVSSDPQFRSGSDSVAPVYWNLVHGGMSAPLDSWTVPLNYPLSPGTYHARVRQRVQATPAGAAEQGINWTPAVSFQVY